MNKQQIALLILLLLFSLLNSVYAQNTGGVFGPIVNKGHKSFQYRATLDPDNTNATTGFAQRLHYQQAINDDFMWRIVGQTRKTNDSDFDFDYLQGELFWQLQQRKNYSSGVRFDIRTRDNDRPDQVGVNWMHEFVMKNDWGARALVLTTKQIGNNSASGIFLQTRFSLQKSTSFGGIGVETFNSYGSSRDIPSFSDQSHTIGPYVSNRLSNGWSAYAGAQLGITNPAADLELRFWLTKSL